MSQFAVINEYGHRGDRPVLVTDDLTEARKVAIIAANDTRCPIGIYEEREYANPEEATLNPIKAPNK